MAQTHFLIDPIYTLFVASAILTGNIDLIARRWVFSEKFLILYTNERYVYIISVFNAA